MSGHGHCYDEASEDGSTGYSEYCDDETIRAVPATLCDTIEVVTQCSSSATSPTATLGKRKSPDESGPSYGPSASYKKRTISSSFDFDSLTASSSATLLSSDDIPTTQPEYDDPKPYIIVSASKVSEDTLDPSTPSR
jgi:hypothetical protein